MAGKGIYVLRSEQTFQLSWKHEFGQVVLENVGETLTMYFAVCHKFECKADKRHDKFWKNVAGLTIRAHSISLARHLRDLLAAANKSTTCVGASKNWLRASRTLTYRPENKQTKKTYKLNPELTKISEECVFYTALHLFGISVVNVTVYDGAN